jgi:hypothetical protein
VQGKRLRRQCGPGHVVCGAGYAFIGKGIDFKTAAGQKTFHHPKPGSTQWYVENDGTKGKFDYGIWLKGPDGTCHADPSIMN